MHSAVALMLFSLASAGTQAGSIQGYVKVAQDGSSLDCLGVWLIPRSPETDAAIEQKFGKLDEGVQVTPIPSLSQVRLDPPPRGTLKSRCRGRISERFEFSGVPAGEYYLTLTAVPTRRFEDENKFRPKRIEMMQRVLIAPGSLVKLDFKHND